MNEAVDPDSPIGQTARAWALAIVGEDFPPERSRQFGAWLDADPLHRRAYEQAETVVMMLGDLRAPAAAVGRPTVRWRVPVMAAAGGLLAACLALAVLALPGPTYETQPGQSRQVALSDGSQVVLAPGSRLRAASRWRPRALALERGEAFFVVAHQPSGQPFTVQAGDALVRVVGTRFDVHRGVDSAVRVEVEQGVVQVSDRPNAQGRAVTLRAGQTALADAHGLAVGVLAPSSLAGGWRQGRLAYDDAPLSEVVADLNRYSRRPLAIGSPAAARLKVTAAFDVAQADRFVAELPRVLPVRLVSDGRGGRVLVAADPGRAPEPHAP